MILQKQVKIKDKETIYRAAKRAGVKIKGSCEKGSCGKCKVRLIGDAVPEPKKGDRKHLSEEALSKGYRLACLHRAEDSLTVEVGKKKKKKKKD